MTEACQATWDVRSRQATLVEPEGNNDWQTLQENTYDGQTWRIVVKRYDAGSLDKTRHVDFTS